MKYIANNYEVKLIMKLNKDLEADKDAMANLVAYCEQLNKLATGKMEEKAPDETIPQVASEQTTTRSITADDIAKLCAMVEDIKTRDEQIRNTIDRLLDDSYNDNNFNRRNTKRRYNNKDND